MGQRIRDQAPAGATGGDDGARVDASHALDRSMKEPIIAKRLVLHVGGYDLQPPHVAHRRFVRELRRFEATWSVQASATEPEADADTATWRVATSGPNWRVDTLYRFVRWDDV